MNYVQRQVIRDVLERGRTIWDTAQRYAVQPATIRKWIDKATDSRIAQKRAQRRGESQICV